MSADTPGGRVSRRKLLAALAGAALGGAASSAGRASAQPAARRGGQLKIAEVGEPLTLDVVFTTADLTSTLTLGIFEELFAFDERWRPVPFLVDTYIVSPDGTTYTLHLRHGVPFHNGEILTADDVVASLNRWGAVSPRGSTVYQRVDHVSAVDPSTVQIRLREPFAPLLAFLSHHNGAAAIMPRSVIAAAGSGALKQWVGTGPYRFVEWAPDRYVHVTRFDRYAARADAPSGFAGRRDALVDDVYYYPVSQVETRIAGVQSGQYDIADDITQDAYAGLKGDRRVVPELIRPGNFTTFHFNKKQGPMTSVALRQAVLAALDMGPILQAAFGNPELYALGPSFFPRDTPWYSTAGAQWYDTHDPARAKGLMQQAGYRGQPIRWLSTMQYDYIFKTTTIAAAQLQAVGMNVDVQVLEWASVLSHRAQPPDWELFTSAASFVPDPSLFTVFGSTFPGWWDTPEKNRLYDEFNRTTNARARVAMWGQLQTLFYTQVPWIRAGDFYSVMLRSRAVQGFRPNLWITPWGVTVAR